MKDDVELQVSYDTLLTDMCKQNYTQKCEHTSWSVLYFFFECACVFMSPCACMGALEYIFGATQAKPFELHQCSTVL